MQSTVVENGIKVRYIGQNVGARLIVGGDDRVYRGGNNRLDRIQYVHPDDVELLKDSFEVVSEAPKTEPELVKPLFVQYPDKSDLNPESIGASDGQPESKPSRKRGTE